MSNIPNLPKFRYNENPTSTEFTRKLNIIVQHINASNNVKVHVKGGTGSITHLPKSKTININIPKSLGTTGGVVETTSDNPSAIVGETLGTITKTVSWPENDDVSVYTVTIDGSSETINSSIIDEDVTTTKDMRDYIPWLPVDAQVPVMQVDGIWVFVVNHIYAGSPEDSSIGWNETDWRAMSVYK